MSVTMFQFIPSKKHHMYCYLIGMMFILLCFSDVVYAADPVPTVRFIDDFKPMYCTINVQPTNLVTFHYTAHTVTKQNTIGTLFDETNDYQELTLQVTNRGMLPALARGMLGMCIDGRRTIRIPWQLAFGEKGYESVPGKTDVVFVVHLINIQPFVDQFMLMDTDRNGCVSPQEMREYVEATKRVTETNIASWAAHRLFQIEDKNGDGMIECEELRTTKKNCDIVQSCLFIDPVDRWIGKFKPEDWSDDQPDDVYLPEGSHDYHSTEAVLTEPGHH